MGRYEDFQAFRAKLNDRILKPGEGKPEATLVTKRFFNLDAKVYEPGAIDEKNKELLGLTRTDELDRAVLALEERREPVRLRQQEAAALVFRRAAGEPDGQRLAFEHRAHFFELGGRGVARGELALHALAAQPDHPVARALVGEPDFFVRDIVDPRQRLRIGAAFVPV